MEKENADLKGRVADLEQKVESAKSEMQRLTIPVTTIQLQIGVECQPISDEPFDFESLPRMAVTGSLEGDGVNFELVDPANKPPNVTKTDRGTAIVEFTLLPSDPTQFNRLTVKKLEQVRNLSFRADDMLLHIGLKMVDRPLKNIAITVNGLVFSNQQITMTSSEVGLGMRSVDVSSMTARLQDAFLMPQADSSAFH